MSDNMEISCRNTDGVVYYFDSLEDALNNFISYDGYRLSLVSRDISFHVYREELPSIPKNFDFDRQSKQYDSKVIVSTRVHHE
jgi:hypothetical protein